MEGRRKGSEQTTEAFLPPPCVLRGLERPWSMQGDRWD